MAQQITALEKLIEAQEAASTSSIDRAIDDMLALAQAMLPGARRALRDGAFASAGDREDLEDLRAAVADARYDDERQPDIPTHARP